MRISLVRMSLMQFLKNIPLIFGQCVFWANLLHYCEFLAIFAQKIALMKDIAQNLHNANRSNEINLPKNCKSQIFG